MNLLKKGCVVIIRFVNRSTSYMVNIARLAHTWFKLSESSPPYPVACRGRGGRRQTGQRPRVSKARWASKERNCKNL